MTAAGLTSIEWLRRGKESSALTGVLRRIRECIAGLEILRGSQLLAYQNRLRITSAETTWWREVGTPLSPPTN